MQIEREHVLLIVDHDDKGLLCAGSVTARDRLGHRYFI
jgi:hypothetical protein